MESNIKNRHQELYAILKRVGFKEKEELESYIHALLDIEESIEKVYNVCIRNILDNKDDPEIIQNNIWDIREEFRHIDYHISDANLTD